jgi:hypothetical protein
VYYKVEASIGGGTYVELSTPGTYDQSSLTITLPDTRTPYLTAVSFRVWPSNMCGAAAAASPVVTFTPL